MKSSKSGQPCIDERAILSSISLDPGPVTSTLAPPSPLMMHNVTASSMTPIQSNQPLMQSQESGSFPPIALPRVLSIASLETVLTTSKMAGLQSLAHPFLTCEAAHWQQITPGEVLL